MCVHCVCVCVCVCVIFQPYMAQNLCSVSKAEAADLRQASVLFIISNGLNKWFQELAPAVTLSTVPWNVPHEEYCSRPQALGATANITIRPTSFLFLVGTPLYCL